MSNADSGDEPEDASLSSSRFPHSFPASALLRAVTNFYLHNFGDYARDTGHLSILEHGAYRKLLDYLYATEKPLPLDENRILRLMGCRSVPEKEVVLKMLKEFFTKTPRGWTHKRYLEELKRVNAMRYRNRENGKKGGRPRKYLETQSEPTGLFGKPTGNPLETQNNQTLDSKTLDSRLNTNTKTPLPPANGSGGNGNGPLLTHDELLKDERNYSYMAWGIGHIVIRTGRHKRVLSKSEVSSMSGCSIDGALERIRAKGFWAEIYQPSGKVD